MFKNQKLSFICQDAAPAQFISSFIRAKKIINYNLNLSILAEKIFKEKKIIKKSKSLDYIIKNSDLCILGTSWRSKKEISFLQKLKEKNIKNIIILDASINLKKRFLFKKKYVFPDEIWITKEEYNEEVKNFFLGKSKIKFIKNYYLARIIKLLKKKKNSINYKNNYLFLSQPLSLMSKNNFKYKFNEYFYLKKFFKIINLIIKSKKKINEITIRYHPAEKNNKYFLYRKNFLKLNIKKSQNALVDDIKKHYYIFGMNTFAMKVALYNNNKIISLLNSEQIDKYFLKNKKIISAKKFIKFL